MDIKGNADGTDRNTNQKLTANLNQTSLNQMDQKQIVSKRTAKRAFDKKQMGDAS